MADQTTPADDTSADLAPEELDNVSGGAFDAFLHFEPAAQQGKPNQQ